MGIVSAASSSFLGAQDMGWHGFGQERCSPAPVLHQRVAVFLALHKHDVIGLRHCRQLVARARVRVAASGANSGTAPSASLLPRVCRSGMRRRAAFRPRCGSPTLRCADRESWTADVLAGARMNEDGTSSQTSTSSQGSPHHAGNRAKKKGPEMIQALDVGGGGGNRTRVRKHYTSASTYVAVSLYSHLTLPEQQGRRLAS
jgi:hypothetical protein